MDKKLWGAIYACTLAAENTDSRMAWEDAAMVQAWLETQEIED